MSFGTVAFGVLLLSLFPFFVSAHEEMDSVRKVVNLGQVVVTGTRTPKQLLSSPVLTRVISASDIRQADATNLQDLMQQTLPGVEFSYAANQQVHMNFAGFGGQSMLILVDGERLAGETMDDVDFCRLTMDNVDHVEIVKGAASALYGSNAAGGVINIITKEPAGGFALNVNGRWGKHNQQRYGLLWQQGSGRLSSTFSAHRNSFDNYQVTSGDHPVSRVISTVYGDATWNFREQMVFRPSERLKLTGRAGYFFRQVSRSTDTPERYRDFSAGLRGGWAMSDDRRLDVSYSFDQYDKSDYQRIARLDIRDYSNVQNTLRLVYTRHLPGGDVLSAGADYLHDYLLNDKLSDGSRHQDAFNTFVQYDWNISGQWELLGALRYDYFSDHCTQRLTPKLSASYRPIDRLNLRIGYGMGFRAPTLKEKYYQFDMAGIWTIVGNPDLRPEVSHNFNLSAEYRKGRYDLTVSGYYNAVKHKITTGIPYYAQPGDLMPCLPYVNLENYTVMGAETSVRASWTGGFKARLAYTFTHEQLPKNKEGKTLNNQYIPARRHSINGSVHWAHRFAEGYACSVGISGRWFSGVDNQEYVDYYDTRKGTFSLHYPGYGLLRLSLGNSIGKALRVTVTLDNLLDYKPDYYYLNSPVTDGASLLVGVSLDIDRWWGGSTARK